MTFCIVAVVSGEAWLFVVLDLRQLCLKLFPALVRQHHEIGIVKSWAFLSCAISSTNHFCPSPSPTSRPPPHTSFIHQTPDTNRYAKCMSPPVQPPSNSQITLFQDPPQHILKLLIVRKVLALTVPLDLHRLDRRQRAHLVIAVLLAA